MNTYTKLADGSWGVRVKGPVKEGDFVLVKKRDGQQKNEKIACIVSSEQGVSLCAVSNDRPSHSPATTQRENRGGRCRGCGGAVTHAAHHRAMEGYCGACAFDEFDC